MFTAKNSNLKILDKILEKYDVITDTPVARCFKDLDLQFPGSTFIYTIRDIEEWLDSCQFFFNKIRQVDDRVKILRRELYGTVEFDRELFKFGYERHHISVLKHFEQRKENLLILNICEGEGWEKLCLFLGVAELPECEFPYKNKSHWQRQ